MIVEQIHSEEDYDSALREIAIYFSAVPAAGTVEAARFDLLTKLIEDYESETWAIYPGDPAETGRLKTAWELGITSGEAQVVDFDEIKRRGRERLSRLKRP